MLPTATAEALQVLSDPLNNQLLASLPVNVFEALRREFSTVDLPIKTVLSHPEDEVDWIYFPQTGMVSILHVPDDGEVRGIEIATVGKEGVVGAMAGLG